LEKLREHFTFSLIDAGGGVRDVERRIMKEFQYQSSLELGEETFDAIQTIPIVDDVIKHTRQDLVKRLENYQLEETQLFKTVIQFITDEMLPSIKRHLIAGHTVVRTHHPFLNSLHPLLFLSDTSTGSSHKIQALSIWLSMFSQNGVTL